MIPAIGVRVQDREGVPVAYLQGEIDIANASEMRDQLLDALSDRPRGLIVDLSSVTYLDSRGMHVMLELAERMKIRHQQLRVVVPVTALIRRIFELTHFDLIAPLDNSVEDAVAHMRAEG